MFEALLFLVEGFEEIEALTALDVLRRGGVNAVSVSLTDSEFVTGAHQITVKADLTFASLTEKGGADRETVLILPGGPGTANYKRHEPFLSLLRAHYESNGRIAAICAAPSVLGGLGMLEGKTAVCYPSFEPELKGASLGNTCVVTDGAVTTSKGPATALLFALEVLRIIKGTETVETVSAGMLEPLLKEAYA